MKNNEYQCDRCGGVFEKGWSDDEAKKEAEERFGKPMDKWDSQPVLICDDCYKVLAPKTHPEELEKAKQLL